MTEAERRDLDDLLAYLSGRSSPPFPNDQAAACVRAARAEIEALRAKVKALEGERAWRPISEAPRDGTPLLIYVPGGGGRSANEVQVGKFLDKLCIIGGFMSWDFGGEPTAWQPLPSPPKAAP